jgi:hypothetical protein
MRAPVGHGYDVANGSPARVIAAFVRFRQYAAHHAMLAVALRDCRRGYAVDILHAMALGASRKLIVAKPFCASSIARFYPSLSKAFAFARAGAVVHRHRLPSAPRLYFAGIPLVDFGTYRAQADWREIAKHHVISFARFAPSLLDLLAIQLSLDAFFGAFDGLLRFLLAHGQPPLAGFIA